MLLILILTLAETGVIDRDQEQGPDHEQEKERRSLLAIEQLL
jgi:hypothetical protein